MKKQIILLTLCLAILMPLAAFAQQGKRVSPYALPKKAQTTFRAHFAYGMPVSATIDKTQGYEVMMNDHSVVRFDRRGDWTEVVCTEGVPETLIPLAIRMYISKRFEDVGVDRLTRSKQGYTLGMANGMDLQFDNKGNFVAVR